MNSLENKAAFVTGGGQGIGRGIALELAKAGAAVVIADLNLDNAKKVAAEINNLGGSAIALYLDVTDTHSIKASVKKVLSHFPDIRILVNNAGVMQKGIGADLTTDDFDLCYSVNLKGVWLMSEALIPHFKQANEGKIVNIASIGGRRGAAYASAYCTSKAAVISLTQSLAAELGPDNINVNAVCPGTTWTPMYEQIEAITSQQKNTKDAIAQRTEFKKNIDQTQLGRACTPEDIGHAVVFLASEYAKNITGQALNVDGGHCMR